MPDWYPNFPYVWVSWSNWLSAVDTQVKAVLASGDGNISAFELWNEPDWTWNTAAAGASEARWARTFDEVSADDPSAEIQGPSYSAFNASWMTTFLTAAKASGTLPNVLSLHGSAAPAVSPPTSPPPGPSRPASASAPSPSPSRNTANRPRSASPAPWSATSPTSSAPA